MPKPQLSFGLNREIPDAATCAWGARLIFPADLLWDRQDLRGPEPERLRLKTWLNSGPLRLALESARRKSDAYSIAPDTDQTVTLFEDDAGIILGNPQRSFGYLYVAAWMKHEPGCHCAICGGLYVALMDAEGSEELINDDVRELLQANKPPISPVAMLYNDQDMRWLMASIESEDESDTIIRGMACCNVGMPETGVFSIAELGRSHEWMTGQVFRKLGWRPDLTLQEYQAEAERHKSLKVALDVQEEVQAVAQHMAKTGQLHAMGLRAEEWVNRNPKQFEERVDRCRTVRLLTPTMRGGKRNG